MSEQLQFPYDLLTAAAREDLNKYAREAALAVGERMAELCAEKAQRTTAWDPQAVSKYIVSLLASNGQMSGEALTNLAKAIGWVPHDDRAFGAVIGSLSRRGVIRCVGYVSRLKGHGTAGGREWMLVR